MASKEPAYVHPSQLDRMGALAKWIAVKAEEMAQLDRKIERRLDHLQRSEDNLRAMFEAIREQVTSAHAVSDELRKSTIHADESERQADTALVAALEKAAALTGAVEAKTRELEQAAEGIVQSTADRLSELMEQARSIQATSIEPPVSRQSHFDLETASATSDFDQRSAEVVESIRRSAVEQIERLSTQAAVAVDPILSRIEAQRKSAEAQLSAAVDTAADTLRRRAEELCRTGDTVVDTLEHRLARRLENVRPKTMETLAAAEAAMNQRLLALTEGARQSLSTTEADLVERAQQLQPRLNQMLQSARDDLVEELARLEEHAFSMTGWLEQRMSERVEALITRTRTALTQTPLPAPAPTSAEGVALICYADEYSAPAAPDSVDVRVFVDQRNDRRYRSTTASIFK